MLQGTVLVVEDEEGIASLVRAYLEREGLRVFWASSIAEALRQFDKHPISLAILDRQLPDGDGLELCRVFRSRQLGLPVIMLTVRDDEQDRIGGLEAGADDYVTKPFSPRELILRVRAVMRRLDPESERISFGDLLIDRAGRVATLADAELDLTGKEFDLLAFLLEHPGKVLSREQLLDRVWGLEFPGGTRTVDVHVAQLRKKLGRPELIRTVRGQGYKAADEDELAAGPSSQPVGERGAQALAG
jgi:DNA-binding response OmpR family regulator